MNNAVEKKPIKDIWFIWFILRTHVLYGFLNPMSNQFKRFKEIYRIHFNILREFLKETVYEVESKEIHFQFWLQC